LTGVDIQAVIMAMAMVLAGLPILSAVGSSSITATTRRCDDAV
jgi:hypothetical protein